MTCCQDSLNCSTLCGLYACSAHSASPADLAGATILLAGACAGLSVLLSDTRLATAGTGGEAVRPGGAPKEASSCSRIFGLRPAGSCFLTALPTLECTYSTLPVFARTCEVPYLVRNCRLCANFAAHRMIQVDQCEGFHVSIATKCIPLVYQCAC